MKQKIKLVFTLGMLISIMGISQNPIEKDRLKAEAERFITIYNTGDTLQYHRFLSTISSDGETVKRTLQGHKNTYNLLGKVEVKDWVYVSTSKMDLIVKEGKYDTWWRFMISTDENQKFLERKIIPLPLPEIGLKSGKLKKKELQAALDDYITHKLDKGFSGNVFISKSDKTLYNKSFGKDTKGKPNTLNTQFSLASAGKMFTAIAILQLQDQKKLDLDNTVVTFLPDLKNNKLHAITLAQLLTHTSGMGDFFESPLYEKLKDDLVSSKSFMPFIEADKLHFAPGTDLRYSNTGFGLLGIIIEKISGLTFQEYVEENIFEPLKMKYTAAGTGAGGGTSTVGDIHLFLRGLNNGQLLGPSTQKCLFDETVDGHYGYGTEHHLIGHEHIVGHSGGFINVCVELNLYPNTNHIAIVLSNTEPPFGHFLSNKIKELLVRRPNVSI
ncbi:serine hydrolase domain-containing protein [Kriegella aquimaris]|uniref:CubicO group peptidase, beta-lactamase class C family n=1 Tax=Kriegella aquimaris TaxID=192904 RepID=A0A1G9S804_9FLAO|nr:serine hydrolase domain-containing protein [Kriegella aquimaris]SDM31584.1 CubicO group peptidase, beta-lactamase class C family [Kriegella aquimaris]